MPTTAWVMAVRLIRRLRPCLGLTEPQAFPTVKTTPVFPRPGTRLFRVEGASPGLLLAFPIAAGTLQLRQSLPGGEAACCPCTTAAVNTEGVTSTLPVEQSLTRGDLGGSWGPGTGCGLWRGGDGAVLRVRPPAGVARPSHSHFLARPLRPSLSCPRPPRAGSAALLSRRESLPARGLLRSPVA